MAYPAGASFEVGANEKFQVKVERDTAYLCSYEYLLAHRLKHRTKLK